MAHLLHLWLAPVLSKRLHQGSLLSCPFKQLFFSNRWAIKLKIHTHTHAHPLLNHGLSYLLADWHLLINPKAGWGVLLWWKKLKPSVKVLARQKTDLLLTLFSCYYRQVKSQSHPTLFLLSVHPAKSEANEQDLFWPGLMALASSFRLAVNPTCGECIKLRIQPTKEKTNLKRLVGAATNWWAANYQSLQVTCSSLTGVSLNSRKRSQCENLSDMNSLFNSGYFQLTF